MKAGRTSGFQFVRYLKTQASLKNAVNPLTNEVKTRKMSGWQIHSYGDLEELQFSDKLKIPVIKSANEILVKVAASGVNPIDIAMIGGYGSKVLNTLRCNTDGIELPLVLGREFSGEIYQKGLGVSSELELGEHVWGVVPFSRNGCHSEYVVVPEYCISRKPAELSFTDAGGMLYAALTAWSGIFLSGRLGGCSCDLLNKSAKGRRQRILVLGASGGVGSAAVQILKAEQATVIASCSTDAIPTVKALGADHVIDYTKHTDEVTECGPYNFILDCAGLGQEHADKLGWSYGSYITFTSPLLRNIDDLGFPSGIIKNIADILRSNANSLSKQKGLIKWAYFIPSQTGIQYLRNLVETKKFLPLVDSTFDFHNARDAYEKVRCGHLRGKVIINVGDRI